MKEKWIENLRGTAGISVIAIHSLNSALLLFGEENTAATSYVLNKIFMNLLWWGVPCFLMITGYLLLDPDKEISLEKLFKKYIWRIVFVLLLFGTVFSWMELIFDDKRIGIDQIGRAFLNVVQAKSWAHLWYLYTLIALYLLLPIYRLISKNISDNELTYFLIVCFVFLFVISKLSLINISLGFYIDWTIYPFWMFLGYAKRRKLYIFSKKTDIFLLVVSIVAMAILSICCYVNGYSNLETFFGYNSPIVVIMANSLFNIYINSKATGKVSNVLNIIANNSFGIYIVHMFFVNTFYKVLKINPFDFGLGTCVITILVFVNLIASYLLTAFMKKIPILKEYIYQL